MLPALASGKTWLGTLHLARSQAVDFRFFLHCIGSNADLLQQFKLTSFP
jgi:hypothetical protein